MTVRRRADSRTIPVPPKPVVLGPSGTYDGDDGKWSTFTVNIAGDGEGKGQNFKVLISTSSPITLIPSRTDWCSTDDCAKRRGILDVGSRGLDTSSSSPYSTVGLYSLPLKDTYGWSESLLSPKWNETTNASWGTTTVGLGTASKQSLTIQGQYVATYVFKDFFLGSIGLAVGAISPVGATRKTFLSGLAAAMDKVPSSSYGFTAGASYRNGGNGATGNMVFGGYDQSRLVMTKGVSIPMPNKQNNTLLVGVNSIIYTPQQNVEPRPESFTSTTGDGFLAAIDSTLPYLVLPDEICDRFVKSFDLGFDSTTGLYTIDSAAHERNKQQNATVTFVVSAQTKNSASTSTIVFPYDAFHLQASDPIYANTTDYFPIRKSDNGRYILGRTFLQEAYIIVDYERGNFTVAPTVFSNPLPRENLVAIYNTSYVPPQRASDSGGDGLAAGGIAGIVIGIVAAFLILGGAAFLYFKKRRNSKVTSNDQEGKPTGIDTIGASGEMKHRRVSELTGSEAQSPPQFKVAGFYGGDHKSIPELPPDSPPAELYSPPLDGTNEPDYFTGPKPRRRGATRDSSITGTPNATVAELAGDEGMTATSRPKHSRGPSDNSLSTNIDEVLAGKEQDSGKVQRKHSSRFVEHTGDNDVPPRAEIVVSPVENTRLDETGGVAERSAERRPSHTRGLSDSTVASDNTVVSQPTPEELENWAKSDDAPKRS
ncbi:hypothetical protein HBI44_101680 [Parastagonospora nodorum]|nr:hypothetical protein HBI44_101680 [Parastagonospora nodorum]